MKVHNFSAGPSILPRPVIEEAAQGLLDINGSGLSISEISHRSKMFMDIIEEAEELLREILNIGSGYEVLFLTGGASTQFFMTAMNLLSKNDKAAFIDTGSWSSKAIKEAQLFGQIEVLASSKDKNYSYIPKEYTIPTDIKYLHYTSNNTIIGTQFHKLPHTSVKMVCDMSSDIFGKPIDIDRYGIIYAGAQKNLGPAGTTLVIIDRDFLGESKPNLPTMLNYHTHIAKRSLFNTPPVFPIYMSLLTLRWLKRLGGVSIMENKNQEKAKLLYDEIDRNAMFYGMVEKEDRSLMNVCFLLHDPSCENLFMKMCQEAGIVGVKGHRSVGGFRASIYNAMPFESVSVLIDVMQVFEEQYG